MSCLEELHSRIVPLNLMKYVFCHMPSRIGFSCKRRSAAIYDRADELCHARLLLVTPIRNHPMKTLRENSLETAVRR